MHKTADFVEKVTVRAIELHQERGCWFQDNTKQEVLRRFNRERAYLMHDEQFKNWLEQTLLEYEVYCPHEGIDRRETA